MPAREVRFAPCPDSPNCVSSQSSKISQAIAPIPFAGSREQAMALLKAIVRNMKRTRIVQETADYLHAECRTILGFVDDLELYVDVEKQVVEMRSASRTGYWDLGVNRGRLEAIRKEFGKAAQP